MDVEKLNYTKFILNKYLLLAGLFLALGLLVSFYSERIIQNPSYFEKQIQEEIATEIRVAEKTIDEAFERIKNTDDFSFSDFRFSSYYTYYIFRNSDLIFWSRNHLVPTYNQLEGGYQYKLLNLVQGQYLSIKRSMIMESGNFEVFAIIPIYQRSKINNAYLQSGFNQRIFSDSDIRINEVQGSGKDIVVDGQFLFSVNFGSNYYLRYQPLHILAFLAILLAIVMFVAWIYVTEKSMRQHGNYMAGFIFLAVSLIILRVLMLSMAYPFSILEFDLFDSRFFASSSMNPSLGDLFLNEVVVILLIIYIFRHYTKFRWYRSIFLTQQKNSIVFSWLLLFASFFILLGVYELMMNMQKHAQWSIDISTNIDFSSSLKWVSLCVYGLGAFAYFTSSHIVFSTFIRINKQNNKSIHLQLLIAAILFISFNLFSSWPFLLIGIVHGLYFLTVYHLKLNKNLIKISYLTFIYLFVSMLACSTIGAYTIYKFYRSNSLASYQITASQLLADKDILGEYLLNETSEKIRQDLFISTTFSNLFSSKEIVRNKIRRRHINNYLDRYDIDIYLFDQRGVPVDNSSFIENYYQFREKYALENSTTEYPDIYIINGFDEEAEKGYISFIPIHYQRFRSDVGYVILMLKLKKIIPNSVYPELLVDQNINDYSNVNRYIIYKNGDVEYSSGLFNEDNRFTIDLLENPQLYTKGINRGNSFYLGVNGENDRVLVIARDRYPLKNILANFSFLFLLMVFVILLFLTFYAVKFRFAGTDLNLAAKIQLYLNVAFFLPLFAISITTLSLLNSSYKEQLENEYYAKAENVGSNISSIIDAYYSNQTNKEDLSNKLVEIGRFVEADLNLFDIEGRLIASTQPLIYEDHLLSEYVPPVTIEAVVENGDRLLLDESVGTLAFKNTYYGIKSFKTGNVISILSIPFFGSKMERENQIIDVLSNIMVLFTLIFIIFLALSYFASRFLTYPLRYITQKIKKISLSGTNSPMVWNSKDEIGLLVGEYNRMLINLEASKKALAHSEKESAWREMAQQVAHEIKNPLTPMKLNLQHLKRTLNLDSGEADQMTEKAINNLLTQIETLSDIATSFSTFAKMPIPKNERIDLVETVKTATQLHSNDKELKLTTRIADGPVYVLGDEQLLGRIINNLIINGTQSVPDERTPEIFIGLEKKSSKALIEIKDNGSGIPKGIEDKIFIPKFSTKETGSGIGLAIAKRGIEQAGGSIWFETYPDVGTSFFIELPLVE